MAEEPAASTGPGATGSALNFTANLNIDQVKKNAAELEKLLSTLGIKTAGDDTKKAFDTKPLTEFQAGILKLKQDTLDLAKEKQAQQQVDKQAALDRMQALRDERKAIQDAKEAATAKAKTVVSDTQAEVDAYNNATKGIKDMHDAISLPNRTNAIQDNLATANPGSKPIQANTGVLSGTDLSAEEKALQNYIRTSIELKVQIGELRDRQASLDKEFKEGELSANSYAAKSTNLATESNVLSVALKEVNAQVKAQAQTVASADGSYVSLQATLSNLTVQYKALTAEERNSSEGTALRDKIKSTNEELKKLDAGLGNHQRSVGDYGKALLGLSNNLSQVIPGLGTFTGTIQAGIGVIENGTTILSGYLGSVSAIKTAQSASAVATSAATGATATSNAANLTAAETAAAAATAYALSKKAIEELSLSQEKLTALKEELATATLTEAQAEEVANEIKAQSIVVSNQLAKVTALEAEAKTAETVANDANTVSLEANAEATTAMATAQVAATTATEAGTLGLRAFKIALLSTGIGAVIVLLGSLYSYFTQTQEGINSVTRAVEPLKIGFNFLVRGLGEFGKSVVSAFSLEGLKAFGQFLEDQILNRFKAVGVVLQGLANFDFKQVSNGVLQGFTGVTDVIGKTQSATKSLGEYVNKVGELSAEIAKLKIERDKEAVTEELQVARLNVIAKKQGEIARDSSKDKSTRATAARTAIDAINEELKIKNALLKLDQEIVTKENSSKSQTNATQKAQNDITVKMENNIASAAMQRQRLTAALNRASKPDTTAINSARALGQQLTDSRAEALRAQKTADDSEVAMVKDKYEKQKKIINDFYADPKHNGNPIKIDGKNYSQNQALGYAKTTQDLGLTAANAKVDFEAQKDSFDQQKVLFNDYEQYKLEVGQKAADERFGKDTKGYVDFVAFLKAQEPKEGDLSKSANLMRDYLKKAIPDATLDATKRKDKEYTALLVQLRTYQEQVASIDEQYAKRKQEIQDKNPNDPEKARKEIKLLDEIHVADTDAVKASVLGKAEAYKHLNEQIIEYTKQQLQAQIEAIEFTLKNATGMAPELRASLEKELGEVKVRLNFGGGEKVFDDDLKKKKKEIEDSISIGVQVDDGGNLTTVKLTTEEYKKQVKALADINAKIKESNAIKWQNASKDLAAIGGAFDDIASIIPDTNAGLKDTFSALGEIAKVGSDAAGSVASFMSGDVIGGITKGVKALTGAISFFNRGKESAKKAAAELKTYQDDLFKSEIVYNELLRDRARTLKDIGLLSISELNTQKALLANQTAQAQNDYNRLLAQIQGSGQQITGTHIEKHGGIFGIGKKSTTVQDLSGVAGADYEELEKLYTEGKLTDATKTWFEALQKAKGELDAIGVSTDDVLAAINQAATGTTASSIADAIISGFKEGKKTAADFADDFKGLMEDAALSAFKSNYLNNAIGTFYKQFAAASADGLSDEDVATLKAAYSKIIEDSATQLAGFDQVIGGIGTTKTATGISGAIVGEAIKEDTANALLGMNRGQYDQAKLTTTGIGKLYTLAVQHFSIAQETLLHVKRGADNTDQLGTKLDKIIANTTSSAGDPFRNAGVKIG